MRLSKETRQLLCDIGRIRSKSNRDATKKYLGLSLIKALKKAQERRIEMDKKQNSARTDREWWNYEPENQFCDALIAIFEGLLRGRRTFPSVRSSKHWGGMLSNLELASWARKVKKTNPH